MFIYTRIVWLLQLIFGELDYNESVESNINKVFINTLVNANVFFLPLEVINLFFGFLPSQHMKEDILVTALGQQYIVVLMMTIQQMNIEDRVETRIMIE